MDCSSSFEAGASVQAQEPRCAHQQSFEERSRTVTRKTYRQKEELLGEPCRWFIDRGELMLGVRCHVPAVEPAASCSPQLECPTRCSDQELHWQLSFHRYGS